MRGLGVIRGETFFPWDRLPRKAMLAQFLGFPAPAPHSPEQPGLASALSLLPQGWDGGILSAQPATAVRDPRISNA